MLADPHASLGPLGHLPGRTLFGIECCEKSTLKAGSQGSVLQPYIAVWATLDALSEEKT
jgi:hypothetical protein